MTRRLTLLVLSLVFALVLALPAFAQQPSQVGNADGRDGGASAPGPHCHFVLPADDKSPFERIITGAIHQAHVQTGLPTGVFEATPCP